ARCFRRVAHQCLQELWEKHGRTEQDHTDYKEHQVGTSNIENLEQTDVHDGFLLEPFPDHQRDQAYYSDDNQSRNEIRPEPIIFLAFIERDLESSDTYGEQGKANVVESSHSLF